MNRAGMILVGLALVTALAPAAVAQAIRSAEQGAARLAFEPFTLTGQTVTVKEGEKAWTETVRHADTLRLLDELPVRTRPSRVAGIPAGTILTGYRLSSGIAYCGAPKAEAANKEAQCLRDLDGDGTFDAAQMTEWRKAGDATFEAYVKTIVPISKARYEKIEPAAVETKPAAAFYAGAKKGVPEFRFAAGISRLDQPIGCTPVSDNVCDFMGVRVRYAVGADKTIALTFESAADNRVFEPYRLAFPSSFD